ncbi:pirin family protein [Nakamurella leprariae]|uniref:Pirin family protein n=1 Tax=Nakamurella leprariae TaxID=2803911 RepID=A0A938YG58_9ACTN|nr:pirin family protein [Nakamurella leprariae]MBM9467210.1 pirin family protein [Nakamurella leprariae]
MSNLEATAVTGPAGVRTEAGTALTLEPRLVPLGGIRGITVARTLPHRRRPTVGAWCFVDHFGPDPAPMVVLPHPHTGLQTVTWLFAGAVRHRDSLGSDVWVRPGQLNLMTAGPGVAHSEISQQVAGEPDEAATTLHGLQLWLALPGDMSAVTAAFEHHGDLPTVELPAIDQSGTPEMVTATVLVGTLAGVASPATVHSPLVGAQIVADGPVTTTLPVDTAFEHAVLPIGTSVRVDGEPVSEGHLHVLPTGADRIELAVAGAGTVMLLGGTPFTDDLVMWWNFIGRSHEDIAAARTDWESVASGTAAARYGTVTGHDGARIPAPDLPGVRLTPRRARPS